MKKLLLFLLAFLPSAALADSCSTGLMPLFTAAQAAKLCSYFSAGTIGTIANNTFAVSRNAANDANLSIWKADGSNNTHLNAATSKVIDLDIAVTPIVQVNSLGLASVVNTLAITAPTAISFAPGNALTPVASLDNTGLSFSLAGTQPRFPAAAVITPSTTFPTPNAGDTLTGRNTILAAGAPTAAYVELPRATASVGKTFSIFNQGSNPVAIVPQSGDTQGVSAAATPFACTTLKSCDCTGLTTSNFMCGLR